MINQLIKLKDISFQFYKLQFYLFIFPHSFMYQINPHPIYRVRIYFISSMETCCFTSYPLSQRHRGSQ